jgi:hypothetical protein
MFSAKHGSSYQSISNSARRRPMRIAWLGAKRWCLDQQFEIGAQRRAHRPRRGDREIVVLYD